MIEEEEWMGLKRQQIGNTFCLAGVRQENAEKAL